MHQTVRIRRHSAEKNGFHALPEPDSRTRVCSADEDYTTSIFLPEHEGLVQSTQDLECHRRRAILEYAGFTGLFVLYR